MSAAWLVLASLAWTGLIVFGAELATRGRVRPHFAQSLWRSAAFLMILPWLVAGATLLWPSSMGVPIPEMQTMSGVAGTALGAVSDAQESVRHAAGPDFGRVIVALLIAGWIWRLGNAVFAQICLQRLKRNAVLIATPSEKAAIVNWTNRLGLKTPPQIARMNRDASPFIAGVRQRIIYLPQKLACECTSELILAHECVHLARGDLLTRPLERLVADILWFSPFAWMVRARLDYLREAVCDAETVIMTGQRTAYARALTHVARSVRRVDALPVSAFILRKKSSLPKRVNGILGAGEIKTNSVTTLIAVIMAMIAAPLAIAQGMQIERAVAKPEFASVIVKHRDARVTSPYGMRVDPWGKEAIHRGIDIEAPKGVSVMTPAAGEVILADYDDAYGWHVKVRFSDGTKMRFANLGSFQVAEGDRVLAGDVIGKMGVSGKSTGPHVHVEYWQPKATETGHGWSAHDPNTIEGLDLICSKPERVGT